MRDYSKTGGKPGRPAYRTPSSFRFKKSLEIKKVEFKEKKHNKLIKNKQKYGTGN